MSPKDYQQKDVTDLQEKWSEEKQCLMRIISTYGMIAESFPEHADEVNCIKSLLKDETSLPQKSIENSITILRKQIFAKEVSGRTALPRADQKMFKLTH